jgi:hypothetical protein
MSSNKQNKRGIELEIIEEPIIELIEEIDKYNEVRSAFRLRDNIPLKSIPIIMKHYFKSSEKIGCLIELGFCSPNSYIKVSSVSISNFAVPCFKF